MPSVDVLFVASALIEAKSPNNISCLSGFASATYFYSHGFVSWASDSLCICCSAPRYVCIHSCFIFAIQHLCNRLVCNGAEYADHRDCTVAGDDNNERLKAERQSFNERTTLLRPQKNQCQRLLESRAVEVASPLRELPLHGLVSSCALAC